MIHVTLLIFMSILFSFLLTLVVLFADRLRPRDNKSIKGGEEDMAYAWALRIIAQAPEITIDNVPESRKAKVLEYLAKEKVDGYGKPLEEK